MFEYVLVGSVAFKVTVGYVSHTGRHEAQTVNVPTPGNMYASFMPEIRGKLRPLLCIYIFPGVGIRRSF